LIVKPDAFKPLFSPDCSHCKTENARRKDDLRSDDRVLCFRQVFNDGYTNDGGIPLRFFLNAHRVLSDSWGVFVYDPDAGYARGFRPVGRYTFYGWRNGVMVMKGDDGTLYSCLTGIAFQGPKKGTRLEPRATLVSGWGFWHKRYPQAMAFTMFEKYQPVELPTELNEDSVKSRGPVDKRLPADTPVLGVWDGKQARAYPLDVLKKAGVVHEPGRVVLWYEATRTAAAYRLPTFGSWTLASTPKTRPHRLSISGQEAAGTSPDGGMVAVPCSLGSMASRSSGMPGQPSIQKRRFTARIHRKPKSVEGLRGMNNPGQRQPPKRVVFVCVENSNRSQMAEAFARIFGEGRVEAYSAGSRPSGRVHPKAVEAMREIGYDLERHRSKGLWELPDVEFDVAVTMGCGDECPALRAKRREDWNIPCPKAMLPEQFRAVRDKIGQKVKALLAGL
jgi:protein-tyrosine-phosphatase